MPLSSFQGLCSAFDVKATVYLFLLDRRPINRSQFQCHRSTTVFAGFSIAAFSLLCQFNYSALASPHLFRIKCRVWFFYV